MKKLILLIIPVMLIAGSLVAQEFEPTGHRLPGVQVGAYRPYSVPRVQRQMHHLVKVPACKLCQDRPMRLHIEGVLRLSGNCFKIRVLPAVVVGAPGEPEALVASQG